MVKGCVRNYYSVSNMQKCNIKINSVLKTLKGCLVCIFMASWSSRLAETTKPLAVTQTGYKMKALKLGAGHQYVRIKSIHP